MLNPYPFTGPEIRYFCWVHCRTLQEKPSHMGIPESFFYTIRVLVGICFGMVDTVIIGPRCCRASKSEASEKQIDNFDHWMRLIGFVRKKSVISCSDSHSRDNVEKNADKKSNPIPSVIQEVERCHH